MLTIRHIRHWYEPRLPHAVFLDGLFAGMVGKCFWHSRCCAPSCGYVFQRPAPFPTMIIYDNVLSGFSLNGIKLSKAEKDTTVERCLKSVALWDEVKDVLNKKGTFLSGGQQQRLCIARALAMKPDVLLMDEPTSALDPIATKHIEELLLDLQKEVTILIVTHNMGQAKRISSKSMFMYLGELVEYGDTERMFTNPIDERTKAYLTGKMG